MEDRNVVLIPTDSLYARDLFVDLAQDYDKVIIQKRGFHYEVTTVMIKEEERE